jgi:hypothetical protein
LASTTAEPEPTAADPVAEPAAEPVAEPETGGAAEPDVVSVALPLQANKNARTNA